MIQKSEIWLTKKRLFLIVGAASFIWFLFTAGLTVLRYKVNLSSTYDFGIFSQMFYYMDKMLEPLTTCERDGLLSHFAVHLSPIFYTLLPVYKLFPRPETLLIMQALLVISGLIPLYLLCRHFRLSNLATLSFCLLYCAYPAFIGGCFYDFHENKFLTPIILWCLYFLERKSYRPMMVFLILLLFVKEDAPVYAACIGLYLFFEKKEPKLGSLVFFLSCLYFVCAIWYLNQHGDGAMINRFDNLISDKDLGLISMFKTLLVNPAYVLSQILTAKKITFLLGMLLPLGFLPLFSLRIGRWFLVIPFVLINLLSNYGYQHSVYFQYTYGSGALLFYLALINYRDWRHHKAKSIFLSLCLPLGATFLFLTVSPKTSYWHLYRSQRESIAAADQLFEAIPQEASVKASTFFVPKLSMRDEIYMEEDSKHTAQYVVLDMRYGSEAEKQSLVDRYLAENYEVVHIVDDYAILLINRNIPEADG